MNRALLEIDQLRRYATSYGSNPYCFGLGFIQLKLSENSRMHFWHEAIPHVEREEIHNHRYDFKSTVLAGRLRHQVFDVKGYANPGGYPVEWERFDTECIPGEEGVMRGTTPVYVSPVGENILAEGSIYKFPHTAFHTTEGTEFAITYLERGEKVTKYASVVKKTGTPSTCPFANPGTPEQCWELIYQALNWAKLGR